MKDEREVDVVGTEGDISYCQVATRSGMLRGRWRSDERGQTAAFLGIPFAQAPVGERRFAAPVPVEPWTGVRDALQYGPTTERANDDAFYPDTAIPGDATLNLNVFTPRPGEEDAKLPVLVWFHGGAYIAGSITQPWVEGRAYNREGVVTVALSYRLGYDGFGWIEGAPANRGVLDWIAGLEWVQENIAAFGGDPSKVTISGQSAGGGAVLTLLGMEVAQHLFSGVHAMSAAFGDQPKEDAIAYARAVGKHLGVEPTAQALRALPEEKILEAQAAAAPQDALEGLRSTVDHGLFLAPVVDGELIRRPTAVSLAQGIGADKPLLLGATEHEATMVINAAGDAVEHAALPDLFDQMGFTGVRRELYIADNEEFVKAGNAAILGRYVTDGILRSTVVRIANARGGASTWVYRFCFVSTVFQTSGHCLDIPFWFDCLQADGVEKVTGSNPPQEVATAMHRAALALIKDRDPGWTAWSDEPGVSAAFGGASVVQIGTGGYDGVRALLA